MTHLRPVGTLVGWVAAMVLAAAVVLPSAYACAPLQVSCADILANDGFETQFDWILSASSVPTRHMPSPVQVLRSRLASALSQPFPTSTPTSQPAPVIIWVGNLNPNGSNPQTLPAPAYLSITVEVNAPPVTGGVGQGMGVTCLLQYATVQYFGGPWSNLVNQPMVYIGDAGPSDRYAVTLGPLSPGLYQYTAWCITDGSVTWVPATPYNPGQLTVIGGTPTPTPTAGPTPGTPSPTSIPPECHNLIVNDGFEWDGAWILGPTSLMPFYAGSPSPVHSGARSMALGATVPSQPDIASYSSAQQVVTIPAFVQTAQLRFWYYPSSNAAAGGLSRQEAILLDPRRYGETVAVLWRVTENNNAWIFRQIDLTPYRGRTVSVYFNARNAGNGTRTAMYLDDVQVLACGGMAPHAETLPGSLPPALPRSRMEAMPAATMDSTPPHSAVAPPGTAFLTPNPQTTVLSVLTPSRDAAGPTTTPTTVTNESPPDKDDFFLTNLLDNLSPPALAVMIGLIVLGAILLVIWLSGAKRSNDNAS